MDSLDKIAEIMTWYYKPIQMIEQKYRNKVTAIGLLKSAQMSAPHYLEPYLQRLLSYKELIKDHTENLKMAGQIAVQIFVRIIQDIYNKNLNVGTREDFAALNHIITLVFPKYDSHPENGLEQLNKQFLSRFKSYENIHKIASTILSNYLNSPEKYDLLADKIVKRCLTGVTQEDVLKHISTALYNFFIYGLYSRKEATDIYNITLKTRNSIVPMEYFTKMQSLVRHVINKVGNYKATVLFFGKLWDEEEEISKLFKRNTNITVMYY